MGEKKIIHGWLLEILDICAEKEGGEREKNKGWEL